MSMIPLDRVRDWLADHGYRDLYPRRDAIDPDVLFYTFVRDDRRRIGFPVRNREVDLEDFEGVQKEVWSYEHGNQRENT